MNELSTAASFFKEGGIVMYFMLAIAVFAISIASERFIVISRAGRLNSRKLVEDLMRCIQRGDVVGARRCARVSNAPAALVAEAILHVADGGEAKMQAAADDAATLALAPLSRRLPQLNVLANVATLLGLLGTISGLITAFSAVGAADPAQRSAFMAAGISTALNATAFGLLIAIPTLIVQGYLVGMVEGIAEQVDEISIRLSQGLSQPVTGHAPSHVLPLHAQKTASAAPAPVAALRAGSAAQGGVQ
jgi:biopolymer transport protein ExbB